MNPTIVKVLRGPHAGRIGMIAPDLLEQQVWVNFNYTQRNAEWDLVPLKDIQIMTNGMLTGS